MKTEEELFKIVQQIIQDHRLHYTKEADDEDSGLSVLDRLTPDDDDNVTRGIEEIEMLTEAVFEAMEEYSSEKDKEIESLRELLAGAKLEHNYLTTQVVEADRKWKWLSVRAYFDEVNKRLSKEVLEAERKGWNEAIDEVLKVVDRVSAQSRLRELLIQEIEKIKK